MLFEHLGIKTLAELEGAAQAHKITPLILAEHSVARISGHHLDGPGCEWPITQGAVRPYRIVFPPPALYQDLGLLQGGENLPVEELITQLPI